MMDEFELIEVESEREINYPQAKDPWVCETLSHN